MLTTEDIALLRKLVEWRRANGWSYAVEWDKLVVDRDGAPISDPLRRHTWESPELPNGERANVEAIVINGELWAVNWRPDYGDTTMVHCRGGSFAALVMAAFQAGVDSLATEWAIRSRRGGQVWCRKPEPGEPAAVLKALKRSGRRGLELVCRKAGEWMVCDELQA